MLCYREGPYAAGACVRQRAFRTRWPIRLVARVDPGYRRQDGAIVLVELKTRCVKPPNFSDIIELSAQRLAVKAQRRNQVADAGYIVIQEPGSRKKTAHRVRTLTREEVIALAKWRDAIRAGLEDGQYTLARLCEQCAFLQQATRAAEARRQSRAVGCSGLMPTRP